MTESVLTQIFILLSSGVARQNKQVQQILTTLWNKRCLHGFLLLILKNYWMRCWLLYCLLKEVEYQMYITTCTCMSSLSSVSSTYRWKQRFAGFAIFPEYVLIPSIFFLHIWRKHKKVHNYVISQSQNAIIGDSKNEVSVHLNHKYTHVVCGCNWASM